VSYFMKTAVNIEGNKKLRSPQIEAYLRIKEYFSENPQGEALVVLPTGTGKSGLISIAPFSVANGRVLIITPGLVTKKSIQKTQEALKDNFWIDKDVIFNPEDIPTLCEYRNEISDDHLNKSDIIYSNIHKLIGSREKGLTNRVPPDFFDLIIVDEAHHAPAESWQQVFSFFNTAKKLHVTGTPFRGDNKEVPGENIHETPLSEAMRERYVSWLRKETVNAHELFFIMPERPGEKLTKDAVLQLKDKEWLEKSVALSEECSRDVIEHSINKLNELNNISRKVPHKILAVGCSIAHATDLFRLYKENGIESVIVHSEMEQDKLDAAFRCIDNHQCRAVISVNMLMEGYDHSYLSILAIFRPYRSLNSFAQVVGRVLRTIPEEETTAFEIDNNALVIYHHETGLDSMWATFQKEIDRAKHTATREYTQTELDYENRTTELAGVSSDRAFIHDSDSYLEDLDFNELFAQKRTEIQQNVDQKINEIRQNSNLDEDDLIDIREKLTRRETKKLSQDIDPTLLEKRPDLARIQMRKILTQKSQDAVTNLLTDLGISEKDCNLAPVFSRWVRYLKEDTPNDGTLVMYINLKLLSKFGPVKDRDNKSLLLSIDHISAIIEEIRRMLQ